MYIDSVRREGKGERVAQGILIYDNFVVIIILIRITLNYWIVDRLYLYMYYLYVVIYAMIYINIHYMNIKVEVYNV